MSRSEPGAGCYDLGFQAGYPMSESAEVALEDYARSLLRSQDAEALRAEDDPSVVKGVHVCGLGTTLSQPLLNDLEDFARGLVSGSGGGLGWS
jgi:hypothetical protein